jgi:hypothetical protein
MNSSTAQMRKLLQMPSITPFTQTLKAVLMINQDRTRKMIT